MLDDARNLKEATGKAEPVQPRPVTLFTGQWADLPFEEVRRLAVGLGLRRAGDRLLGRPSRRRPRRRGRRLLAGKARHARQVRPEAVFAISNHLKGQAVCDDPIDDRHQDILPDRGLGRRRPGGCPAARRRGDEEHRPDRGPARRRHRRRVHRIGDLEVRRDVPAGLARRRSTPATRTSPTAGTRSWTSSTRSACGSPTRSTPRRSPTTTGPRVATLDAIGHRPALRAQLGPVALRLAGPGPGRLHPRLRAIGSTTWTARTRSQRRQRPERPARVASAVGGPTPRLGLRLHRARRCAVGDTASGRSTPSATPGRSRSNGRTPAWTGSMALPKLSTSSAA